MDKPHTPKADDAAAEPAEDPNSSVAGEEDPGAALDTPDGALCCTEQSNGALHRRMRPWGAR